MNVAKRWGRTKRKYRKKGIDPWVSSMKPEKLTFGR